MELFGKGYVIDHCISLFKEKQEEKLLKVYITDGLKTITETLQRVYGGASLNVRWIDLIDPKEEETRTGEEIIQHMKDKIKALGGEDDDPV